MAKAGFTRNSKTVARILHQVDGGKRAAAEKMMESLPEDVKKDAFVTVYHTDREVVGVVVPAVAQARDGVATRAAGTVGLTPG